MSGFGTLFTRDLSQSVPLLDRGDRDSHSESGAPGTTAPDRSAPIVRARKTGALERTAPVSGALKPEAPEPRNALSPEFVPNAPASGAPESSAPIFAAPETDTSTQSIYRKPRIREAVTVQDAHTLAEQAVYDAMYRAGRPHQGESRILTIGLRTLAEMSRMAYSNCKANVRSLVEKLAIDAHEDFSYTTGRTYIVYSFRDILRRRKAAGLTHVIRTRGVLFVDPSTGREVRPYAAPPPESSAPDSGAPVSPTGALESVEISAPVAGESSAPAQAPHIRNRHLLRNSDETTTPAPVVVAAVSDAMGHADDDAAQRIIHACREVAPDVTNEEIAHFVRQEGPALRRNRGLDNPMGVLIRHIPRCCQGESLRLHRQAVMREKERNRRQIDGWLHEALEILARPDAGGPDRVWAQDILAAYGSTEGFRGFGP
jgi:hypothetical protein